VTRDESRRNTKTNKAKKRQGFTFSITKPETGKFGLTVIDLKVECRRKLKFNQLHPVVCIWGYSIKEWHGIGIIGVYQWTQMSHKRAVELLPGEIKIIAMLNT